MNKILIIIIIISFNFAQLSMNFFIRQDSIYVGDLVNFIIELNLSENQIPIFPDLNTESEELSIGNKIVGKNFVEYELTFWEAGNGYIPQIPIQIMENNQVKLTLETDSLIVKVFSSLNQNNISLRDIKDMRDIEILSKIEKSLILILIILGLISLFYLWNKRKKIYNNKKIVKYQEPIHIKTIKELENLQIEYPINWENTEKYYLQLTFLFRKYLAEEFYFKALEMTTNEIIEFFMEKKIFIESLIEDIKELLNRADLSKYAMQIPVKDYFVSDKDKTIKLIESLHEKKNNTDEYR